AIETDYVEPMPEVCSPSAVCGAELLIYGSIDGMLRTLDPHSSYFPPRDFARMRERQEGRYFGIGIQIQQDPATQDVTVTSLFEGSPPIAPASGAATSSPAWARRWRRTGCSTPSSTAWRGRRERPSPSRSGGPGSTSCSSSPSRATRSRSP